MIVIIVIIVAMIVANNPKQVGRMAKIWVEGMTTIYVLLLFLLLSLYLILFELIKKY